MDHATVHEIELVPPEVFKTLLKHEVNKSRRYGDSLSLVHLSVEANPATLEAQRSAEAFIIDVLNVHLRDTDIPCKQGREFLILLPSTSAPGARTACERLRKLITIEHPTNDEVSFQLTAFIGMATMPADHLMSSEELAENASRAFQHAQINGISAVVAYSESYK